MAVRPGKYDILLQRRADYYVQLSFSDSNDTPVDLTGWTVTAHVWNKGRTKKSGDFLVNYVDRPTGVVELSLTDEQTTGFPDELYYDVLLEDPSGLKEYYLEGVINVSEGYTA